MNELVKQYLENKAAIEALDSELREFGKGIEKAVYSLKYDVYNPKIQALKDECLTQTEALLDKGIKKGEETKAKIRELHEVIYTVNRILLFLKVRHRELEVRDDEVKVYNEQHSESLGYFFDDEFLKIKLFIVENRKPKNKYSLCAYGRCFFSEDLLKLTYSYSVDAHDGSGYSLKFLIRDAPTISELKEYLRKNQKRIMDTLLGDYFKVKEEYLNVLKKYHVEDFKELIEYQCGCGYFYTKEDNFARYRDEIIKCPYCGNEMKELA